MTIGAASGARGFTGNITIRNGIVLEVIDDARLGVAANPRSFVGGSTLRTTDSVETTPRTATRSVDVGEVGSAIGRAADGSGLSLLR